MMCRTLLLLALVSLPVFSQGALIGFVAGAAVGSAMSSGNTSYYSLPGTNIIFVLPRLQERLKNPMGVMFACAELELSPQAFTSTKKSRRIKLWEIFRQAEPEPERFEILEVSRLVSSSSITFHAFCFAYAEKGDVTPLEKLTDPDKSPQQKKRPAEKQ